VIRVQNRNDNAKPNPNKPMKINKLILMCGALAGVIIANLFTIYAASPTPAPRANPLITWTASGKQSKKVDVLFVQNAKNVSFSKGKLVLRGVNPGVRDLH
jgi:hypothetical protein